MKDLDLQNITLIALVTCCLLQFGGQLFAVSVVASTIAEAPPRSFAILNGEYGYDSSPFWNTIPPITFVLFIIASASNWKSQRRKLILIAFTFYIIGALVAYLFLEPTFADMIQKGYSDQIDPILQNQARWWYLIDWMVWVLGLLSGLTLLVALIRPSRLQIQDASDN